MAKIENDFLGLNGLSGNCVVVADIWEGGCLSKVRINSTSNKVKRAFNSNKRYSFDSAVKLARSGFKKDEGEKLRALLYRAKVTDKKGLPIGKKGCVNIGVLSAR